MSVIVITRNSREMKFRQDWLVRKAASINLLLLSQILPISFEGILR